MYGEPYWDESAYYQFTLKQIEQDLEQPTEDLQQMCLQLVEKVVNDEYWLAKFAIPQNKWEWIRQSWLQKQGSLYSRFDLAYNGSGPAKFYENNADTPTSLYESGFWQWLWLEDKVNSGQLPRSADQFNSIQEKLIARFDKIITDKQTPFHFSSCKDTEEDRGTVQYLQDCATAAGIKTKFVYIEEIGIDAQGQFVDQQNNLIDGLFKLYPWEFMFEEQYHQQLTSSTTQFIEPPWKAVLSNKAILPLLWQMFPNHPNLLPAYFADAMPSHFNQQSWVKKPLFSREGANISVIKNGETINESAGPYGEEGYIYQQSHVLPQFDNNFTLIGSWLIGDEAAGISIREDKSMITQDMSRFLPHVIV